ncbi:diguanylate cyclase [Gemmatirosa kalamazoonensis]|uniref:Diguanylate cyclase n=1 Tax=Gemmatirosa kalamazoonensis TaxID=861299 RepID=W0RF34_9BACT|nr:GGDEF domain-containing protein [Gemmatirosa kalamazoonensis]AHG89057.1 diguanylate cyclase [Gemmatirosa kalamazoonensis]
MALASIGSVVSSMLALQLAQALLTAGVLWVFQRRFGYPVLAYWTYGWVAMAGQLVGVVGFGLLEGHAPPTGFALTAIAVFTLLCEYLRVAWLVLGAFAIAEHRDVPDRPERWIVYAAAGMAVVTAAPFATTPGATFGRFVARVGVMAVLTGVGQLAAGVDLWTRTLRRYRRGADPRWTTLHDPPALGQRLVAAAFVALGALALVALAEQLAAPPPIDVPPVVLPVAEAQLLLNFALGLGLVIWLLEGEQRRTLEAAHRAEHMAYHDALTGLPNRLLLMDRLKFLVAHAKRTRQPFAVFFLDVDHFKSINDTFGHAAGDRLLQQVGARLTAQLREADTVARLGGDEFVVLTPDLRSGTDVAAVGEKLLEAARAPVVLEDREVRVTVSIGVSLFPDDGEDADVLLRRSDSALYQAKESGRDAVRLA